MWFVLASSLLTCAVAGSARRPITDVAPRPVGAATDSLEALYSTGRSWADFYAAVNARKSIWNDNYEQGKVAEPLLARARSVGGTWRFLVVAVDSCSDSANTIPFLARLVEQVPGLELRIVDPTAGRWVMDRHRTADGRAATPTVVLLDEAYAERGCFIERPTALRHMLANAAAGLDGRARYDKKMRWYQEDAGAETVADLVLLLERAAEGRSGCE